MTSVKSPKLPAQHPLLTVYTWGTQILHQCRSQLKIRSALWVTRTKFYTQQQHFSYHYTKISRPGLLVSCICLPFVSALRVGQLYDVISPSLVAAFWTRSRYEESLSCSVKDSPPVRLNPVCRAVPFCQPFVIPRHSTGVTSLKSVDPPFASQRKPEFSHLKKK